MKTILSGNHHGDLEVYIAGLETAVIDNAEISYLLVDPKFDPTMRYFAGLTEGGEPFVSSAVPPRFRALFAAHEKMWMELSVRGQRDARLHAVEAELRLVSHADRGRYVALRIAYLEDMIGSLHGKDQTNRRDAETALGFLRNEAVAA